MRKYHNFDTQKYRFDVYILSNYDRIVFYVGYTNSLARRIIEHRLGIGSKFTAKYKCFYPVFYESYQYVYDAISREKEMKKWRRAKKLKLIEENNPQFVDLSRNIFEEFDLDNKAVKSVATELSLRAGKQTDYK